MNTRIPSLRLPIIAAGFLLHGISAHAQLVINDTLTGASSAYQWTSLNGACLTAGDGTGSIPKCVGLSYYSGTTQVGGTSGRLPDAVGAGALRLTNGDTTTGSNGNNETGAVVSTFTFPTTEGIQVTWTSVSYGGNNYNGTGADGISFFLSDAGVVNTTYPNGSNPPTVGALGGSLGYSCSNGNGTYDGVVFGYIGIGIDEFGNFANPGDNTDTGPGSNGTVTGPNFLAGRIAVRGAGYTSWAGLSGSYLADGTTANPYAKYYKSGSHSDAIHNTCKDGYAYNYSGGSINDSTGASISNGSKTHDKLAFNYPLLAYQNVVLPSGVTSMANQEATNNPTRGSAQPIIFSLKITSAGLMDFSYSVCTSGGSSCGATQTVLTGFNIKASNGTFPANFRFGFSAGTGGGSNVHEITCFKATPANLANSSAGSNVTQAGQIVLGGTQVFLAYYHPVNWWGSMTANTLSFDSTNDRLVASTTSNWDGSCVLTGGACQAMGSSATVSVQGPSSRNILTWGGTGTTAVGIPLQWSSLSSAQQTAIGSSDRVNFLRGDRTKEISNTNGTFRNRTSVLGDIIDSSPTWVGAPSFDYASNWKDKLYTVTAPEGTSYASFATTNASRMNVVYVGSNDGLLHAFRAGTVSGSTIANNDGQELLAYMPSQVLNAIHPSSSSLDYSSPSYLHNFYVDATPGVGDLYYGTGTAGAWHTWLVGGLGPGGHPAGAVNTNANTYVDSNNVTQQTIPDPVGAIYALDITNPSATNFVEGNAASLVVGEWNSSTITCTGNTTCGSNLGQVSGTPLIRRLHDGGWGVIWGNGLNSKLGRPGIFIMHIAQSGTISFQYIDAGWTGSGNGIVEVTSADLDGDHITDFVYAGDVLGNVWRFDLHSSTATDWNTAVTKLFTTSSGQPITTAPLVVEIPAVTNSGKPKLVIAFGTGQKLPLTATASEVYASGTQSLYGFWDSNMSTWNGTNTDEKYDTVTASGLTFPLSPSNLTAQTISSATGADGATYRNVTSTTLCWSGSSVCASGNTSMGYRIDLPGSNEQVIYNPSLIDDSFVVNTLMPQSTQALTCGNTPASGFTMAVDIINGSGDNSPYTDGTNYYAGVSQNGAGVVTQYNYNGKSYDGTETNTGTWVSKKHVRRGGVISRLTWTKVR
jgi:type IV pilus assembly protein PilY1